MKESSKTDINYNPELFAAVNTKCCIFGCGATLTPQEQLFGNVCQNHSECNPGNNSGNICQRTPVITQLNAIIEIGSVKDYRFRKAFDRAISRHRGTALPKFLCK